MRSRALVLKSVLFLIPFFSILGPCWIPKWNQNRQKSFENPLQNYPSILNRFRNPFCRFPLRFSTPGDTQNRAKMLDCCSFSYFPRFFFALSSGIDFGPSWLPFRLVLALFFPPFPDPRADKKNTIFESFFFRFWSDFGLHFGPPALRHSPVLGHLPLSWVISRCLGSSPALRCDF